MDKFELLQRLSALFERSRDIELNVPEETGMFSLNDEVIDIVRRLLVDAVQLCGELMDCYDTEQGSLDDTAVGLDEASDFLREIGAQISSKMAAQEISSLAFMSRRQLQDTLDDLDQGMRERKIWKVASALDTATRRAGRALVALETSVCEYEGYERRHRYWLSIDDALHVRRLYGEFRRAVAAHGAPDAAPPLVAAFRDISDRISAMRELEIYPLLRIDDRQQLRRLRKRINTWLEVDPVEHLLGGRHLWSDLESFAQLLAQISLRQELIEHDRTAVAFLFQRFLDRQPGAEALNREHLQYLKPLEGRDDELDVILLHPERFRLRDLRPILERLREALDKPFAGGVELQLAGP